MTDRDDVLLDRDQVMIALDAALDVEPSATFAKGVRVRVAHSRARTRRMWWGLAAAASVTFATFALWRPAVVTETEMPMQAQADTVAAPTGVVTGARPVRRVDAPLARALRSPVAAPEPRLEVITNQPAVLRQMWADDRARAVPVAGAEVGGVEVIGEQAIAPIAVDPIVVAPIVVSEIGTTGGRGGVTPGIRRVDAAKETR